MAYTNKHTGRGSTLNDQHCVFVCFAVFVTLRVIFFQRRRSFESTKVCDQLFTTAVHTCCFLGLLASFVCGGCIQCFLQWWVVARLTLLCRRLPLDRALRVVNSQLSWTPKIGEKYIRCFGLIGYLINVPGCDVVADVTDSTLRKCHCMV